MSQSAIRAVHQPGAVWATLDPFLFCVRHRDDYPAGDGQAAPSVSVAGRQLGSDFSGREGWSLYHGQRVPGFPAHPHRGFETVTITRRGLVDHADSLGAAARYGDGDVQWLTAGRGIQHAEMFPLLRQDRGNPLELFQIWLNLPARRKLAPPCFRMFWADAVPRWVAPDGRSWITWVAGSLPGLTPAGPVPSPPPDSWAADPHADVALLLLSLAPGARFTLPPAFGAGTRRMLHVFQCSDLTIEGTRWHLPVSLELAGDRAVTLQNGEALSECLLLQGRPIGEPVAQHGPFVMNTRDEILQALADYRSTAFGGWPWPDEAPVHGLEPQRFARYPDGRLERPA